MRSTPSAPASASAPRSAPPARSKGACSRATWCWRGAATRCSTPTRSATWASALRAGGLGAVGGRFLVATGALPAVAEIDAGQPEDAPYNPTISGMNLNFNRVFLAWEPGKQGPVLSLSAPGERVEVPVSGIRAELVEGGLPRHRFEGADEVWSLPRPAFRGRGSAWLPVRAPGVERRRDLPPAGGGPGPDAAGGRGGRGGARAR